MEFKRPFAEEGWETTPKSFRLYIIQLEDRVIKRFKETEDLKKRVTVRSFCQSVFGISTSSGTIQKVIDRASQALKPVYENIGDKFRNSAANYIDETSWFQNGMLNWLWVMANNSLAYFMIHRNRSKQAFLLNPVNGYKFLNNH